MRIRIVSPVTMRRAPGVATRSVDDRRQVTVESVTVQAGPATIECEFDEVMAGPDTVARIIEAEHDGCDAVVVNCFADPAVKAGREVVKIPVLGPGESAMHVAAILGQRFSVVTVLESVAPIIENHCRMYGLAEKLASIRWVNIPVLELHGDETRLRVALVEEAAKAIEMDGAHAIVLGCTGMTGLAVEVQEGLRQRGHAGIPVIDPLEAALKLAEALVSLHLSHSKRTYPYPPAKEIVGYNIRPAAVGP
ncbi:MAG: aspartate/glutamate racemase family protein [Armatimonadetes bacterium]|nr:aspartate/glutamate racemase family protein [Armatimonadota bacterium]